MKDIVIYGAGGFGREVQWLIERINEKSLEWNILGYIDDSLEKGTFVDGYQVIGDSKWLQIRDSELYIACAIGNSAIRKAAFDKIMSNKKLICPNLIDPSALISKKVEMGKGNIICAGTIITIDIILNDFNVINLKCTVGHDTEIGSFVTLYPSVNLSGHVKIGDNCEIGTGAQIIQGKKICDEVIIGAGSVVIRDITESGTYVGVPTNRKK